MNSASIWLKFGILGVKPWNGFGVADETSHLVGYLFSGDDHLSYSICFQKRRISTVRIPCQLTQFHVGNMPVVSGV